MLRILVLIVPHGKYHLIVWIKSGIYINKKLNFDSCISPLFFNFMLTYLRYDIHTRSYNNAIRLLGDNDYEFSSKSSNRPVVEIDGCKVR